MRQKLAAPDDGASSVQDCVTGSRIGGARVVADVRAMPFTIEISVGVKFKALVSVGITCDSLSPRALRVLHKVYY